MLSIHDYVFLKITSYIWFTTFHIVMYDLLFFIEIALSINISSLYCVIYIF